MNQVRRFPISVRDMAMLAAGSAIVLLLRATSPDTHAQTPADIGLTCGDWVMQTDQQRPGGDFDAFVLNVKTGELIRTRNDQPKSFNMHRWT